MEEEKENNHVLKEEEEEEEDDTLESPLPRLEVHSPDGMEEKPLFHLPKEEDDDNSRNRSQEVVDPVVPLVELPPPPDGGWGWVVCFAGFMCNLILDGIAYTFGVLLEPLVKSFDSNRSTISLVGSLLVGAYLTSGPIVGGLVNKYGCRPVCIAGAVVSCLGLALSTLSTNVAMLMVTYGLIGGFGLGLVYLPAVLAVNYYFERRRALAAGIAVCGSGVGTFLFAPLATWLLDVYGWRGANLIFAGLCLNCAVFGALMRPLEITIGDPPEMQDEIDEKNNFMVELPDGTTRRHSAGAHSRQWSVDDDAPPMTMTARPAHVVRSGSIISNGEHPTSVAGVSITAQSPTPSMPALSLDGAAAAMSASTQVHLPTIVEDSITKGEDKERKSVMDVFDQNKEQEKDEEDVGHEYHPHHTHTRRVRMDSYRSTVSGGGSKFNVTPAKTSMPAATATGHTLAGRHRRDIPRNSTAPNFVDPALGPLVRMPRISSTPGFGKLVRLHSHTSSTSGDGGGGGGGHHGHVGSHGGYLTAFGIHESQVLSNHTLHLEPLGAAGSRRGSRATVRPLYRKDAFYSGSVSHLVHHDPHNLSGHHGPFSSSVAPHLHSRRVSRVPSFANIDEYRHSIISIPRMTFSRRQSGLSIHRSSIVASHLSIPPSIRKASSIPGEASVAGDDDAPALSAIREMSNLQLLSNPIFLLIGISNILGMLGFYTPFVFMPSMAVSDGGVTVSDANFLISLIGVTNTLCRVIAGWLSDFDFVNALVLTNVAIAASGLTVIALPWCGDSYVAYVCLALIFGGTVAAYISLTSIVLVDLMGLDNLTSAFGLLVLFRGVSSAVGSPLAGFILDSTSSYPATFYISGALLLAAAAVSCAADLLHRRQMKKIIKKEKETDDIFKKRMLDACLEEEEEFGKF